MNNACEDEIESLFKGKTELMGMGLNNIFWMNNACEDEIESLFKGWTTLVRMGLNRCLKDEQRLWGWEIKFNIKIDF